MALMCKVEINMVFLLCVQNEIMGISKFYET